MPSGEIQVNGDACGGNKAVTVEAEKTYHFTVGSFLLGYVSSLKRVSYSYSYYSLRIIFLLLLFP